MNIFVIWLVMVIAWNFGYPEASPLEDVLVAVLLSLFNIGLKKYLKLAPKAPPIATYKKLIKLSFIVVLLHQGFSFL